MQRAVDPERVQELRRESVRVAVAAAGSSSSSSRWAAPVASVASSVAAATLAAAAAASFHDTTKLVALSVEILLDHQLAASQLMPVSMTLRYRDLD